MATETKVDNINNLVHTIQNMNNVLQTLDLNRLLVFRAIWDHRNVSRAADALGVSQPTVSHALRSLRDHFNDRLFVRCSGGVMPTPLAETLAQRIAQPLALLEHGLNMREQFNPNVSRREFTVVMTDIAVAIIMPYILDICRREAPQVSFKVLQMPTESILSALREGTADLAVGFSPALHSSLLYKPLFESEYVCIVSPAHPRIHNRLTRTDFIRERHAVAQAPGTGHHVVESTLHRMGLINQIGTRVPHFLALPMIVAASEMIATIPRPLAELMQNVAPVSIHRVPVRMPRLLIDQFWHERLHDDAAAQWLRDVIPRAVEQVLAKGTRGFAHTSS
ncbi:MAG TPA: LysR family transcriptional regulator [Noviherbaspirillum sp.]|nr:LysR family transcriptional regulator [Noviherbaspirillum sp.]